MKTKLKGLFLILLFILGGTESFAKGGDVKWYHNPLGFSPVNLEQGNSLIVAGVATAAVLLLTKKSPDMRGKFTVYSDAGYSWGYRKHCANASYTDLGIVFHARKYLGLGIELTGHDFHYDDIEARFAGLRVYNRWYPVFRDNFRLYFELGAGIVFSDSRFPRPIDVDERMGTRQNFTPKYGVGAEVRLYKNLYLLGGARHVHLSNANIRGEARNPGHDSNGFFLGIECSLQRNKK